MPYRFRRRARRGIRGTVSKVARNYVLGFLLLAVGIAIVGLVGAIGGMISYTLNITVGSTTVNIPASLLINVAGWLAGIVLVVSSLRKFGIFI